MITSRARVALLVIVTAVGLGLAGCAATNATAPSSSSSATSGGSSPSPSAAPTPTPTPAPTVGAVITKDQIEGVKAAGLAAIAMTDGTYVVVDPNQDLPQAVKDDVASRAVPLPSVDKVTADMNVKASSGAQSIIYTLMDANKKAVVIGYGADRDAEGNAIGAPYYKVSVLGDPMAIRLNDPSFRFGSHDAAVAKAQAWIAAQANPQAYVFLDLSEG